MVACKVKDCLRMRVIILTISAANRGLLSNPLLIHLEAAYLNGLDMKLQGEILINMIFITSSNHPLHDNNSKNNKGGFTLCIFLLNTRVNVLC